MLAGIGPRTTLAGPPLQCQALSRAVSVPPLPVDGLWVRGCRQESCRPLLSTSPRAMGVGVVLGCGSHHKCRWELLEQLCMSHPCSAWPCWLPRVLPSSSHPASPALTSLCAHTHLPPSQAAGDALCSPLLTLRFSSSVFFYLPLTKGTSPPPLFPSPFHLEKTKNPPSPSPTQPAPAVYS